MKFALASDLHLEFGAIELTNDEGADVLILSGDICVAKDLREPDMYDIINVKNSILVHKFFQQVCREFKYVIYVVGNHEHYHGDFPNTIPRLRHQLRDYDNLHILEKERMVLGDTVIVGGTLWTDMNKEDPHTLYSIKGYMNDYKIITDSRFPVHFRDNDGNFQTREGKFSPQESVIEHKDMLEYIKQTLIDFPKPETKFVIVGHHAPSKMSTKPEYVDDVMVNGAYSSDLSELMLDNPRIKVWTHGHTHDNFDYMVGTCNVMCNPRGYIGYQEIAENFKLKYFEIN